MRLFLSALLIIMVIGCSKKDRTPRGVLSKEKMEDVLWDMMQADEFLKDHVLKSDSTTSDTLVSSSGVYERVLALNKTTREEFDSSFNYYRRHPLLMKTILDSINAKQQSALPPPASYPLPRTADSLPRLADSMPKLRDSMHRFRDRRLRPNVVQ